MISAVPLLVTLNYPQASNKEMCCVDLATICCVLWSKFINNNCRRDLNKRLNEDDVPLNYSLPQGNL